MRHLRLARVFGRGGCRLLQNGRRTFLASQRHGMRSHRTRPRPLARLGGRWRGCALRLAAHWLLRGRLGRRRRSRLGRWLGLLRLAGRRLCRLGASGHAELGACGWEGGAHISSIPRGAGRRSPTRRFRSWPAARGWAGLRLLLSGVLWLCLCRLLPLVLCSNPPHLPLPAADRSTQFAGKQ